MGKFKKYLNEKFWKSDNVKDRGYFDDKYIEILDYKTNSYILKLLAEIKNVEVGHDKKT